MFPKLKFYQQYLSDIFHLFFVNEFLISIFSSLKLEIFTLYYGGLYVFHVILKSIVQVIILSTLTNHCTILYRFINSLVKINIKTN